MVTVAAETWLSRTSRIRVHSLGRFRRKPFHIEFAAVRFERGKDTGELAFRIQVGFPFLRLFGRNQNHRLNEPLAEALTDFVNVQYGTKASFVPKHVVVVECFHRLEHAPPANGPAAETFRKVRSDS